MRCPTIPRRTSHFRCSSTEHRCETAFALRPHRCGSGKRRRHVFTSSSAGLSDHSPSPPVGCLHEVRLPKRHPSVITACYELIPDSGDFMAKGESPEALSLVCFSLRTATKHCSFSALCCSPKQVCQPFPCLIAPSFHVPGWTNCLEQVGPKQAGTEARKYSGTTYPWRARLRGESARIICEQEGREHSDKKRISQNRFRRDIPLCPSFPCLKTASFCHHGLL